MNHLVFKLKPIFIATILLCPIRLAATTTVVVVMDDQGIVIATDSKTTSKTGDFCTFGELTTRKFVLIQDRIVITCVGVSDFRFGGHHHNFLTWVQRLQPKLPDNVSVDEFVGIVGKESAREFSPLNIALGTGEMKQHSPDEMYREVVRYLVAGYQAGMPRFEEVLFYADWNQKGLIGPIRLMAYPGPNNVGNLHVYQFGFREVIADMTNRESYAYKQAMARLPRTFGDLLLHRRGISLDEAASFAGILVQIEEDTNPSDVGGAIQTVKILPDRRAREVVNGLSKSAGTEKKH